MLENKSEGDGSAMDEPPDSSADLDDSEFVEIDPTRRYGRYKEVLGKGAFKTVYRAFDEVDGIEVAWNQVKIQDLLQSPEELERLYSEVHLLKSLKHKNIIKFYHSWVDPKSKNVNFITEIFTSGTLRQYRKKHKHVDIKAVKNWARQILRGLLYLHSHDPPIIHRDLKCDNIFVNGNNGEVKIGDLGLAAILRQAHAAHSVLGTPEFMAPELYEEEYNELVDIYSFGMCLLEMVTFEYPYSECTNAAQIYKKVTSGKKPAALEKIKDPDTQQFIEKCLAVASKRLPARELLTDPFLQSDGNREHLECLPPIPHPLLAGDMDDLVVREESGSSHSGVKPGYESGHSVGSSSLFPNGGSRSDSNMNYARSMPSPSAKDDSLRRSRDFRVKGKMRDESTVFLRLRIANTLGHVRNIHFLFDIEGDTAMSVASEMVEELDLSDQDVTTIADMIDAEILALVPEWNPGASFDDTVPDAEECGDPVEPLPDSSCEKARSELDESDVVGSDEPCLERHPSSRKVQSPSFKANALESSPTRAESTMHGRFEEVPYNNVGSEYSPSSSGALLSNSSEHNADEEEPTHSAADPSSPVSDYVGKGTWSSVFESMVSQHIFSSSNADNTEPGELACSAFNDLVESQRNAGCSKYTHQTWEEIMNVTASPEGHGGFTEGERDGLKEGGVSTLPWPTYRSAVDAPLGSTDEEEELHQELKRLTIKQDQEVLELQKKHEQAVLEMKNRWEKRSCSTPSSNLASPDILHCNTTCPAVAIKEVADCSGNQAASQCSESSLMCDAGPFRTVITGRAARRAIESDRLSLKELADMTTRVVGFAVKSASTEQSCSGASEAHVDTISNREADEKISVAVDSGLGFQAQAAGLDGQPGYRNRDSEKGAELLCELDEGDLLGLGTGCSAEKLVSVDRSTVGQQRSLSPARGSKFEPSNSRMTERTDLVVQGRRESYIELYKTCSFERNKLCSSKAETQASEAVAQELLSKPASSKCDDRTLEMKKEQLQRSIAELEAKTLEGLHCSKNGFLASHAPKKPSSSSSVPSASGGSAASQAKPHSESNKV